VFLESFFSTTDLERKREGEAEGKEDSLAASAEDERSEEARHV
jgi:hypothetical protein